MGSIIGGVIGGIGSLFGGSSAKKNDLTGYNYLVANDGTYVNSGTAANSAAAQLTGIAPLQQGTSNAFNNYLNSTGYQFQMNQSNQALTGSAAARGILNSGSTGKALTAYDQGLASQSFNNYLGQLNTQGNQGLTATGQIGSAGTTGGTAAGAAMQSGITGAAGTLGGIASNPDTPGTLSNLFGGL